MAFRLCLSMEQERNVTEKDANAGVKQVLALMVLVPWTQFKIMSFTNTVIGSYVGKYYNDYF